MPTGSRQVHIPKLHPNGRTRYRWQMVRNQREEMVGLSPSREKGLAMACLVVQVACHPEPEPEGKKFTWENVYAGKDHSICLG